MKTRLVGIWKTNNGNTFGPEPIEGKTKLGLKRLINKIIDGNLIGYNDVGQGAIFTQTWIKDDNTNDGGYWDGNPGEYDFWNRRW